MSSGGDDVKLALWHAYWLGIVDPLLHAVVYTAKPPSPRFGKYNLGLGGLANWVRATATINATAKMANATVHLFTPKICVGLIKRCTA